MGMRGARPPYIFQIHIQILYPLLKFVEETKAVEFKKKAAELITYIIIEKKENNR